MKNNFLIILILLCSICLSQDKDNIQFQYEIEFQYGVLLRQASNLDSIIAIENESIVNYRDEVKVNVGYSPGSYFYVIFLGSDGMYSELYSEKGLQADSLYYDTAFTWIGFDDSKGIETLYLINSKDQLNDLESSIDKYEIANGKIRKKLGIKIQNILKDLSSSLRNMDNFATSLEAPIIGGVSFRGDDDDNQLNDYNLTHTCTGNDKIAIRKITLDHK